MQNEKPGYVYVILSSDGLSKIGHSVNPEERLDQLKTGSHSRLTLLLTFETLGPRALEAKLHDEFSEHRVNGEWFNLSAYEIGRLVLIVKNAEDFVRRKNMRLFTEDEVNEIVRSRLDRLKRKLLPTPTPHAGGLTDRE